MSSARFTAFFGDKTIPIELNPDPIVQGNSATATLTSNFVQSIPNRHYVWVYNLAGVKVDVIA
jgi:hypothetical protein